MTAGIPGTGITAMFYIILVLLMPLREMYLTLTRKSNWRRWATVLSLNAMVYLGAALIWTQGELLGLLLKRITANNPPGTGNNILSIQPLKIAVWTLLGVVLAVQLAKLAKQVLSKPASVPTVLATIQKLESKQVAPTTKHIPDIVHTIANMPATTQAPTPSFANYSAGAKKEPVHQQELIAQAS